MGSPKDRYLVFKSKEYLLFWLILLSVTNVVAQTKDKNDVLETEHKRNAFSVGYHSAFYYDPKTSILFPFGLNAEYRLGKSNTSLDMQILLYHPSATHIDQADYYQFQTEYFVQYDLGMRFYFDKRNIENIGLYARPSVGVSTKYYRSVTHDIPQNRGIEVSRLLGKEFIGFQFGYKGKIHKFIFANFGIGTLASFFKGSDKLFILFSPNATLTLGVAL